MVKFQLTDLSGISSARYGSFLGIFTTLIKHTILLCRFLWNSHTAIKVKTITLLQGCTNIPNMWIPPPNSTCHHVTSTKFHPENSQILGATMQNLLAWMTWHMGFGHSALLIPQLLYFSKKHQFNDRLCNIISHFVRFRHVW